MHSPDDRGVSEILGAILLFGVLVVFVLLIQTTAVPTWNQQIEFEHNQRAQAEMGDLGEAIGNIQTQNAIESIGVELGVRYPPRPFLLNPPPATGRLSTTPRGEITITGANATGEVGDYWNGSPVTYETKAIRYTPDYNEYRNPPATIYDQGVVYNEFENNFTTIEQAARVVNGNRIDLVSLTGQLNERGIESAQVAVTPVTPNPRTIAVTGAGGDINITLRTTLSEADWRDVLGDELQTGNVKAFSYTNATSPARATLILDGNVTYDFRAGLVGVGERTNATQPAYLERIGTEGQGFVPIGSTARLTTEVRDKFNAPKSGVNVTYTVVTGDGEFANDPTPNDRTYSVISGSDGQTAPIFAPLTDGPVVVNASAEFNGVAGIQPEETVLYEMSTIPPGVDPSQFDPINPRTEIYLDTVTSSGDTATLSFANNASTTREWSTVRINFFVGQAATSESLTAEITPEGRNTITTVTAGNFEQITPTPLSFEPKGQTGDSRTVTVSFPGEQLQGGDFFGMTVQYKGGNTATYFVSIPGGGGSGGGGGGGGNPNNP